MFAKGVAEGTKSIRPSFFSVQHRSKLQALRTGGVRSMGNLLHWAVVFLVVALVAAFLGFGGVAGTAMEGARLLFWVAVVFLVVSLVLGLIRRA
jgi:uncharacterized membrane protein YtjA (UPF0391 family)